MKIECYLRIGRNKRGYTVKADNKLINAPLSQGQSYSVKQTMPTVITKLILNVPDSLFNPVRANINVNLTEDDIQIVEAQVEQLAGEVVRE